MKDQAIQAGLDMMAQAQKDALGSCYDAGLSDAPPSGGFQQSDIDNAVALAKGADAQALADALSQAHADAKVEADGLQKQIDDLSGKVAVDEGIVGNMKGGIAALQSALVALQALIPVPAPAPVDQPAPAPAPEAPADQPAQG